MRWRTFSSGVAGTALSRFRHLSVLRLPEIVTAGGIVGQEVGGCHGVLCSGRVERALRCLSVVTKGLSERGLVVESEHPGFLGFDDAALARREVWRGSKQRRHPSAGVQRGEGAGVDAHLGAIGYFAWVGESRDVVPEQRRADLGEYNRFVGHAEAAVEGPHADALGKSDCVPKTVESRQSEQRLGADGAVVEELPNRLRARRARVREPLFDRVRTAMRALAGAGGNLPLGPPSGPTPERAGARIGVVDLGGHREAIVGVGSAVLDPRREPPPELEAGRTSGQM